MKKKYVKPMLSKETFALTESVATGCGGVEGTDANFADPNSCYFDMEGMKLFISAPVCELEAEDDPEMFCYNGMTGGMPVFRS